MTETGKTPGYPFRQRLETYLGPDRATAVKDVYRFLLARMEAAGDAAPNSICDMGCASGDLLAFLGGVFPEASLTGVDIEPALIASAKDREELKRASLKVDDVLSAKAGAFDVVTCFGVLGIFDDFAPLLTNLVANTRAGGKVYVQALLNPDDIDVRILYRDNANALDWMRGFNIFSRSQISNWARRRGVSVAFYDFRMTSELAKRPNLPHRAHTVDLADGTRRTINGLCLLLPETLLEITNGGER